MGACKSRQSKPTTPKVDDTAPLKTTPEPTFKLRPDAQPWVPAEADDDEPEVKERWELFLDQKKQELAAQQRGGLRRHRDGHYTSEYRSLLTRPSRKPPGLTRNESPVRGEDLRGMWRAAQRQRSASPGRKQAEAKATTEKKRKPTALKKAILAVKGAGGGNPLWEKFDAHLKKASEGAKPAGKEAPVKQQAAPPRAQDDTGVNVARMPFGISDRCFVSDAEDTGRAQRHRAPHHATVREFVDMPLTPALEAAVTELLFALRRLKMQDLGIGAPGRRFAVGFREVARLLPQPGAVKALVVAPDVEATSGVLEDKIAQIVQTCGAAGVPVVYALSRRQLGQAIQKNVAISVLAVQDVRGAMDKFSAMLEAAATARAGA